MFLFIVFSIGMSWVVSHIFCLVHGLHVLGVRFREADTCMLYALVFNCRGGGCISVSFSLPLLSGSTQLAILYRIGIA